MGNIHIIPTDKPSRLLITIPKGNLLLSKKHTMDSHWKNKNIYITSDEEIKERDYCISHLNIIDEGKIHNSQTIFNPKTKEDLISLQSCKKIILTTDPSLDGVQAIDDQFLEWFVKNPSCEEVEIKTRYLHSYKTGEKLISFSKTPEFSSRNMQCIKIEPRYEIIFSKEEPKKISSEDFGLPKVGTKYFNDLASGFFGGKPRLKEEK